MEAQKFCDARLSPSPVKAFYVTDDAKNKQDNKLTSLNSPFPHDIKTPSKGVDWWSYIPKNQNWGTPFNGSGLYSPFVSAKQQKIDYSCFSMVPKKLFASESSPFKPQVLISTPQCKNQSTIDRELSKDNNQKEYFPFLHCKNLATQFESANENFNDDSLIDNNSSLLQFTQIKEALLNDRNCSINPKLNNQLGDSTLRNNDFKVSLDILNHDMVLCFPYSRGYSVSKETSVDYEEEDITANGEYAVDTSQNNTIGDEGCQVCKCTKSKCLKLYCECFANGRYCNGCSCYNCLNREENESQRKRAYKRIIFKNPKALLKIKSNKKSWNCKCKNSSCQKNYCDCYQNNKYCSSKCKCFDCRNKPPIKRSRGYTKKSKKLGVIHIRSRKKTMKEKQQIVALQYNAMYTPQKKSYRTTKSELKNSISTATHTELTMSIDNKIKRNISQRANPNICKKLEMKDDPNSLDLFK